MKTNSRRYLDDYKLIGCSPWTPEPALQLTCDHLISLSISFFAFLCNIAQVWSRLWSCHCCNPLQAPWQWNQAHHLNILLFIKLIQSTIQATKLRPVISVTRWILPPGHEFPHCQFHPFFTKSLTWSSTRWTGWGLTLLGWSELHSALHSHRWLLNQQCWCWTSKNGANRLSLPSLKPSPPTITKTITTTNTIKTE